MLALETNRVPFLGRFLELCQIDYKDKNLDLMTTQLQPFEEESTPDASIMENNGQRILFIESKLKSGVNPNQLVSHVRSGKGNVPVVCVSSGKVEPPEIKEARRSLTQQGFSETLIRWISWEQINAELNSLAYVLPGKPEIEGLRKSLESESMATPTFKGFTRGELVEASQFAKSYAAIFLNSKQLLQDVMEYVQGKDENIETWGVSPQSTKSPIMEKMSVGFRYAGTQQRQIVLTFDFSKACVYQRSELTAKQLKDLAASHLENILADLNKGSFKLEGYSQGNLEEVADPETLKQLPDEIGVSFSRYYYFSDDALHKNPQELVKVLGDGILWMLDFFKTRDLCVSE